MTAAAAADAADTVGRGGAEEVGSTDGVGGADEGGVTGRTAARSGIR